MQSARVTAHPAASCADTGAAVAAQEATGPGAATGLLPEGNSRAEQGGVGGQRSAYRIIANAVGLVEESTTVNELHMTLTPEQLSERLASIGLEQLALVPHAVMECELVLRHGYHKHAAKRHDEGPGRAYTRDYSHAREHVELARRKQEYDLETGRTNLSHGIARLMLWLERFHTKRGTDDR